MATITCEVCGGRATVQLRDIQITGVARNGFLIQQSHSMHAFCKKHERPIRIYLPDGTLSDAEVPLRAMKEAIA